MSKIKKDKVLAYANTNYTVISDIETFVFKVGVQSNHLKNLLSSKQKNCSLFITGFNPYGKMQTNEENALSNQKLFADLKEKAEVIYSGHGTDPSGEWPPEDSFLALGINLETSKKVGQKYRQDAIVWIGETVIPELILLR